MSREGELAKDVVALVGGKIRFPRRAGSQDCLVLGAFVCTCGHIFKKEVCKVAVGMSRAIFMAMRDKGVGRRLIAHAMEMAMGRVRVSFDIGFYPRYRQF